MKTVKVFCGESVQDKCGRQLHPVAEVNRAIEILNSPTDEIVYSNHPDFVSAIKYAGQKKNINTEFFLNGISYGDDIEEIFKDFNRALDMMSEYAD